MRQRVGPQQYRLVVHNPGLPDALAIIRRAVMPRQLAQIVKVAQHHPRRIDAIHAPAVAVFGQRSRPRRRRQHRVFRRKSQPLDPRHKALGPIHVAAHPQRLAGVKPGQRPRHLCQPARQIRHVDAKAPPQRRGRRQHRRAKPRRDARHRHPRQRKPSGPRPYQQRPQKQPQPADSSQRTQPDTARVLHRHPFFCSLQRGHSAQARQRATEPQPHRQRRPHHRGQLRIFLRVKGIHLLAQQLLVRQLR